MTFTQRTTIIVSCDATLHTACHDHACPARLEVRPEDPWIQDMLTEARWLTVVDRDRHTHYCPAHRDEHQ